MKNLKITPYILVIFISIMALNSCSGSIPQKEDYFGLYTIIKVRENGIILNIDTLSQVELTEELYITAIDRNEDGLVSDREIGAVNYEFYLDENNKTYLKINRDDTLVEMMSEQHFDLLLKKIDLQGNETIIYLKK